MFYWVIDVKGCKRWAFFFAVIGMNAITIYMLSDMVDFERIAKLFLQGMATHVGIFNPMIIPIGVVGVEWLLLWFLYRRKIFFKL